MVAIPLELSSCAPQRTVRLQRQTADCEGVSDGNLYERSVTHTMDWQQLMEAFDIAHPTLDEQAFSKMIYFIEEHCGRVLTMDEFRMAQFCYAVGNRRGIEAMRAIARL